MFKLVLIRHGESVWNKENLFTGWTDVELSEKGQAEAVKAGRILKDKGFAFDVCYTSFLKRAIHTANFVLSEMDLEWLPVIKTWRLNERHYGALQGQNKQALAEKYGKEQVQIWRRSYAVPPPALEKDDPRNPAVDLRYKDVPKDEIPLTESLKDTVARVLPCFEGEIKALIAGGKRVLIAAHGNSIRALVKYLGNISDDDIVKVEIPTGVPQVYELDDDFKVLSHYYLED